MYILRRRGGIRSMETATTIMVGDSDWGFFATRLCSSSEAPCVCDRCQKLTDPLANWSI